MGWFDGLTDKLSSAWDNLKSGDIIGATEDLLNAGFDALTLGTFSYIKDQARGLFQLPQVPYQDRKRMIKSPTGPRQVVYGRCRVGGQLAYIESWFDDRRFLTLTLIVAAHEVEEITAVYANGKQVASARASGNGQMPIVQDGKYNRSGDESRIICWSAKGDQTAWMPATVTPSGVATNPPGWCSQHKLLGQAYVHIFCWFHEDKFNSGLPKFEIELLGKNDLLDPRTGATGYSNNQALVELDVLRWSRMFNLPDSKIDLNAYAASANVADELVASAFFGGFTFTENRYTVNGAFLMETAPLEILQSIAEAGASYPCRFNGRWTTVPGAYSAPVMDFNESDLIGGLSFQPGPGKKARHNMARGSYVDASQDFETVEFSQLRIGAYIDDDLEEPERSFDFPWTTSGTAARRLAKIEIERGRYGLSAAATFKFRALQLTPGDRITLSIDQLGWVQKVFRIEQIGADMNAGVKLELREDAPEIYDWEEGDILALDSPPPLNLPDGLEISPPTNVVITEELYQTLTRAAVKVRMNVSWDADDVANAYDIQYKRSVATKWESAGTFWQDNDIEINDVLDDTHDVRIRAINTIGTRSDWLQLSYDVIGKSAPPPDVKNLFIENGILKWFAYDQPLDLAGFEVRFQNGDRQLWVDATPVTGHLITETQIDVSEFTGTKTFLIKAIDTTGNFSNKPAILVQGLGDPLQKNVIATINESNGWSGTLTGGFINASNEIESQPLGVFWGETDAVFWPIDTTFLMWEEDYERVTYEFSLSVDAVDIGADLTVDVQISGAFNESLRYIPPGLVNPTEDIVISDNITPVQTSSPDFIAFPGSVAAKEGSYTFLLTIPQQAFGAPPKIIDIVTRLDVDDIEESFNDLAVSAGGTRLPITKQYRAIKNVSLTRQADGGTAVDAVIIDKDAALGPMIETRNESQVSVNGNIDAKIQGY